MFVNSKKSHGILPEHTLLIALLRNELGGEVERLLSENMNWQLFISLAQEHRVIPLIAQNLRRFSNKFPRNVLDELQRRAENRALHNLRFRSVLFSLARLLEENNIEFLSYKGATLAQLAYGDSASRQFGDLDVLVHKKDFLRIKKLILANGGKANWSLSAKQETAVLKHYYEFPFNFGAHPVLLEVHWGFMESFFAFDYKIEDVFRRQQVIAIQGKNLPTLSNEDLLIFLCVHGSKHFWKRLSWICDVAKLIQAQPMDWDFVIKLSEKFGCRRRLQLGLMLAHEFLHLDFPAELQFQFQNEKELESLVSHLKTQIFIDDLSRESNQVAINLKMRERWRDKVAYSRRLFTTKVVDSLLMPMSRPR
ncbi:MAG: hypothetical protein DMF69_01335 [Acidobacteria bacterium]|nr:MAG: hypothetical protein DMF69_01335 [Acidobacteriota bacterium]